MNNIGILLSENHRYYKEIISSDFPVITIDPVSIESTDYSELEEVDTIFDFTCFPRESKMEILMKIHDIFRGNLITDLTVNWVNLFMEEFEFIDAAMATSFYSPTKTFEVFTEDKENLELIQSFFNKLDFKLKEVQNPDICFNYPRILSNIINEAYFAKEEKLASEEDIDKAMKFGVNYPLGPFEWAKQIGLDKIAMVLLELYEATGDNRYRMSHYLKREII